VTRPLQRRRLLGERGYTLVEMLTVMVVLGVVITSLTTVFVSASNSETDMNNRFQAQLTARLALDKIRREVHCASIATPTGSSSSVTLTLPSGCTASGTTITWCTRSGGTNRYGLYRVVGASCSGGTKWADFLTASSVFNYTDMSATSLAKLHVDFPVNMKPAKTVDTYELIDDIVLRNSVRQ
jgi:prepilin-type N-terminal cleavage/methylation domain-containing protein